MKKIALIEDDNILSKVVSEELTDTGFNVVKASDGEEGVNLIRNEKPDLVLLDILMPKKNGYQVLEEIKQSPLTRHIPVIILTMLSVDDEIKKGLKLGASDYIVKSQHAVSEIVEKVKNFFESGGVASPEAVAAGPAIETDINKVRDEVGVNAKNIEEAMQNFPTDNEDTNSKKEEGAGDGKTNSSEDKKE